MMWAYKALPLPIVVGYVLTLLYLSLSMLINRVCSVLISNHNQNHEYYSPLSTSMKTDSALQCVKLRTQMSSKSRIKVSDAGGSVPNTWNTD